MPSPLRAPRVETATQQDWDRFALAVESRLATLELGGQFIVREVTGNPTSVTLHPGEALFLSPSSGQTIKVQLPTVRVAYERRLSALVRLTNTGTVTVLPPPAGTINGATSATFSGRSVSLLVAHGVNWYASKGSLS